MNSNKDMSDKNFSTYQRVILIVLRIAIGWHFLYEGMAKLLTPEWSSAGYLASARWIFSGIFHWLASETGLVNFVDFLNVWGLILIGLALIIGVFIRIAGISGIVLLSLYYLAYPPFVGMDYGIPLEGHYWMVNRNLIEIIALLIITIFPKGSSFRLDHFFLSLFKKKVKPSTASESDTDSDQKADSIPRRRELIKQLASLPLLGVFAYGANKKYQWESVNAITGATIQLKETKLTDLKGELPKGKIGDLEMTRLLLGCNLIGGWAHARDLLYASSLFKAYNTEKKILETIEIAEMAGINMMNVVPYQLPILNKYLNITGGKMKSFCQVYPELDDMTTAIDQAIDDGTDSIYIQGGCCDNLVKDGHIDFLAKTIDYIKSQGYLAGVGAHSILVPMACEEAGIDPDYYVKTLHHDKYWSAHPREFREEFTVDHEKFLDHNKFHDNMFDLFPEKTIEFMEKINKPWIAFKVLAGGAITPEDGFRFAFQNGADFICVGMFDFQIVEDVNVAIDVLSGLKNRNRPWMG